MKNYRIEDWVKIYMSFWRSIDDDYMDIIEDELDWFKYESDKMFEWVKQEILNAIKDDCGDQSDKWIKQYIKEYVKKNYEFN